MTPSATDPERIPVVIASGQAIERDDLVSPVDLMERACRAALADVPLLRDRIDRLTVVDIMTKTGPARPPSWPTAWASAPTSPGR